MLPCTEQQKKPYSKCDIKIECFPSKFQSSFSLSVCLSVCLSHYDPLKSIAEASMNDDDSFCANWKMTAICLIPLPTFLGQPYSEELCIVRNLWKNDNFSEGSFTEREVCSLKYI
jgi:hypothetical protein